MRLSAPKIVGLDAAQPAFRHGKISESRGQLDRDSVTRPEFCENIGFSRFNPQRENPFVFTRLTPTVEHGLIRHNPILNVVTVAGNKDLLRIGLRPATPNSEKKNTSVTSLT